MSCETGTDVLKSWYFGLWIPELPFPLLSKSPFLITDFFSFFFKLVTNFLKTINHRVNYTDVCPPTCTQDRKLLETKLIVYCHDSWYDLWITVGSMTKNDNSISLSTRTPSEISSSSRNTSSFLDHLPPCHHFELCLTQVYLLLKELGLSRRLSRRLRNLLTHYVENGFQFCQTF